MKRTGKILALSLAFALCAGGAAGLCACDDSNKPDESLHTTHITDNVWKSDETKHWQLCTVCGEKLREANHSFDELSGKCTVCGMQDPDFGKKPTLPPAEYDPETDDKETPGLKYVEMKDESGQVIGYRVGPGEEFDPLTEELFIPQRHEGLPVLCIGLDPETYKGITESGMSEAELNEVYRANGFYGNTFITTVEMGREVENIGVCAFAMCTSLEYVGLSERLKSIDSMAFGGCGRLSDIELPTLQLESIGYHAFDVCASLQEIHIPDTVKTIDVGAFTSAISLKEVTIGRRVETLGAFCFNSCSSLEEIVLPDSVQSIGDRAFENSGLVRIDFGEGVGSIGMQAFVRCTKLESVELPDSVYEIGEQCFAECLESHPVEQGGDGIPTGLKHVKIGKGLEIIPKNAFWADYALETVELTNTKVIGENAFFGCQALTSIDFGDSLEKIGSSAFYSDIKLTEIVLPDTIVEIGDSAFWNCAALTKVEVGKNISVISERAFERCANIKEVIYHGTFQDWLDYVNNGGGLPTPTDCTEGLGNEGE